MAKILFKTKEQTNANGKPKVYFTCHPDDFDRYFEKICDDILNICDCAIYYTEDMTATISEKDMEIEIASNNLFIIPISHNLLTTSNRALDADFRYAKECGMPILPFMMESGLDKMYSEPDKFGELQYINPFSTDKTEIGYKEKLRKYLESIFVSDDLARRIRSEFDAYIFLSYRKKDRRYANELMHLIHANDELRDIAIWYDEFLTPGESFNENIVKILRESKLFALLVTPNLLEEPDGKPNFVMGEEYPKAKQSGMSILPAEMVKTDKALLGVKFDGIPECVDVYDEENFKASLLKAISDLAYRANDNNQEHNYLIGRAYLDGVDVEINRTRGFEMIVSAAKNGSIEAADALASMYYYGVYVNTDFSEAVNWQKVKIEGLRQKCKTEPSVENKLELVDGLRFLLEIEQKNSKREHSTFVMIELCEEALRICDSIHTDDERECSRFVDSKLHTLRSLAILYELSDDYDKAVKKYDEALKLWSLIARADEQVANSRTNVINKWRIAQIYHDKGILLFKLGEYKEAIKAYLESIDIYSEIKKYSVEFYPNMAGVHMAIVDAASHTDVLLAEEHGEKALKLCEYLYSANPELYDLYYAKALMSRANILKELGGSESDEREKLYLSAIEIYKSHISDFSNETIYDYMVAVYRLAGIFRLKFNIDEALQYYIKSVELAEQLINVLSLADKDVFAHIYFDYATTLVLSGQKGSLQKAKEYLTKALDLFEKIAEIRSDFERFVEESKEVIKIIDEQLLKFNEEEIHTQMQNDISKEIAESYSLYSHFLKKGDIAEKTQDFEKAYLNYKAAKKHLEECERIKGKELPNGHLDLCDRIAYCCEMTKRLDEAKENYKKAVMYSFARLRGEVSVKTYNSAKNYLWKLEGFCKDFDLEVDLDEFRSFLDETEQRLFDSTDTNGSDEPNLADIEEELESVLEKMDFTPTAYEETDELNASDEDCDATTDYEDLFNRLFGELDESKTSYVKDGKKDSTIITLTDDEGMEVDFEFADLIKFQEDEYVVLIPCEDGEQGVMILQVDYSDGEIENYLLVENNELLSLIFEIFKERNKDRFNFTD